MASMMLSFLISETQSQIPSSVPEQQVTSQLPSSTPSEQPSEELVTNLNAPSSAPSELPPGVFGSFVSSKAIGVQSNSTHDNVVLVGFETARNGTFLTAGDYVSSERSHEYGMSLFAITTMGGFAPEGKARIFDTSNPLGDFDLGKSSQTIPGWWVGGRPGMPGENCVKQGNVLIMQESDKSVADDNSKGGTLCFAFNQSPVKLISIGLMDIASDRGDFLQVVQINVSAPLRINFSGLGSNSVQTAPIGLEDVENISLTLLGEDTVTHILFRPGNAVPPPAVAASQSPSDGPV